MFGGLGRSASSLGRHVRVARRRLSTAGEMFPDRAKARARPDYTDKAGMEFTKGEDGSLEYAAAITAILTCAAFLYMPFAPRTHVSLSEWARREAEARVEMKENGDEVEYGVWYSEKEGKTWGVDEEEEEE